MKHNIIAKRIATQNAIKRIAFKKDLLISLNNIQCEVGKIKGLYDDDNSELILKVPVKISVNKVLEMEYGDELISTLDIGLKDKAKNFFSGLFGGQKEKMVEKAIAANAKEFCEELNGQTFEIGQYFDFPMDKLEDCCNSYESKKNATIKRDFNECTCTKAGMRTDNNGVVITLMLEFACECEINEPEEQVSNHTDDKQKKKHENALRALKNIMHKALGNSDEDTKAIIFASALEDNIVNKSMLIDGIVNIISEQNELKPRPLIQIMEQIIPNEIDKNAIAEIWGLIGIGDKAYRYIFEDERITDEELNNILSNVCPGGNMKGLLGRCAKCWGEKFISTFTLPNSIEEAILDDAFGDYEFEDSELRKLVKDTIEHM